MLGGDTIVIDDDGCDAFGMLDIDIPNTKTISKRSENVIKCRSETDTPNTSYTSKDSNYNTIVINEDVITKSNTRNNNNNVIEIDDSQDTDKTPPKGVLLYDIIFKENQLLVDFVEKCLNLEHSEGMLRILNRTLVTLYKKADPDFKKSYEFDRLLLKVIKRLECDPGHKFSHIKCICDTLNLHKLRKRVNLITLATNLNGNSKDKITTCTSLKRKITPDTVQKKQKVDVIDLDNEQESVINLDDEHTDSDVIILLVDQNIDKNKNSDKENNGLPNNDKTVIENKSATNRPDSNYSKFSYMNINKESLPDCTDKIITESNVHRNMTSETVSNKKSQHVDNLLLPLEIEAVDKLETNDIEKKIEDIEKQIAHYKDLIAYLDVQEVCADTNWSPYIKSEKYKAAIVKLYKQLCELTGEQPIKRREVRLQVTPGHPPGPVRKLEQFLNENIGEDGEPPFPDFMDVVTCVAAANLADDLGWSPALIMNEANALFTQCGRALQRRRQEREWRDLLSRVKEEINDPADDDPELLARLDENKRIAMKKEDDIINRFLDMENKRKHSNPNLELHINDTQRSDNSDSDDEEYENVTPEIDPEGETDANLSINCGINNSSTVERAIDYHNEEIKVVSSNNEETIVVGSNNEEIAVVDSNNEDIQKVKQEPEDISMLLTELGDNVTATVIDIEDPFLVIEISSDSESDDDDDEVTDITKDINV